MRGSLVTFGALFGVCALAVLIRVTTGPSEPPPAAPVAPAAAEAPVQASAVITTASSETVRIPPTAVRGTSAWCRPGQRVLSGGFVLDPAGADVRVVEDRPLLAAETTDVADRWFVEAVNRSRSSAVDLVVHALCSGGR